MRTGIQIYSRLFSNWESEEQDLEVTFLNILFITFHYLHLYVHKHTNAIHASLHCFESKKEKNMALSYYLRFGEQLGSNRSLNY